MTALLRRGSLLPLVMGFASWLLLLVNLGGYRPLTQHEVYVAQTARELLDNGHLLRPTYLGEPRWEKPPLAYWLTAPFLAAIGRTPLAARLPASLAGATLVMLLVAVAYRRWGWRTAVAVGLCQCTSYWWLHQARLAETDMVLTVAVSAAVLGYAGFGGNWLVAGAAGASAMAKGPIGPLLIAAVIVAHRAMIAVASRSSCRVTQNNKTPSPYPSPPGPETCRGRGEKRGPIIGPLCLFVVVSLAWPMAAVCWYPEALAVWQRETLGRVADDPHAKARSLAYYPIAAMWLTLPWTPAWIWLVSRIIRRQLRSFDLLLVAGLLAPMVVLSFSAGKQEHYLMPALPAAALLGGRAMAIACRRIAALQLWAPRVATALVASIVAMFAIGQPVVFGRWATVTWAQQATAGADTSRPLVLLGHSVQWLCFPLDRPVRRVDSLEALFADPTLTHATVLATVTEQPALHLHRTVLSEQLGPADPGMSGRRRPLLVQLAPKELDDSTRIATRPTEGAR